MSKPKPDLEKYLKIDIQPNQNTDRLESTIRNNISEHATDLVRNYIKNLKLDENQEIPKVSCGFYYDEKNGLEYMNNHDIIDIALKEEDHIDPDVYEKLREEFKLLFISAAENYDYS